MLGTGGHGHYGRAMQRHPVIGQQLGAPPAVLGTRPTTARSDNAPDPAASSAA